MIQRRSWITKSLITTKSPGFSCYTTGTCSRLPHVPAESNTQTFPPAVHRNLDSRCFPNVQLFPADCRHRCSLVLTTCRSHMPELVARQSCWSFRSCDSPDETQ